MYKLVSEWKVKKGFYLADGLYVRPTSKFMIAESVCGHKNCKCIESGKFIPERVVTVILAGKKSHSQTKKTDFTVTADEFESLDDRLKWLYCYGQIHSI